MTVTHRLSVSFESELPGQTETVHNMISKPFVNNGFPVLVGKKMNISIKLVSKKCDETSWQTPALTPATPINDIATKS